MGIVLTSYYDKVKASGGLEAQVKLAILTKMSALQAAEAVDSKENIEKFEAAMAQIG